MDILVEEKIIEINNASDISRESDESEKISIKEAAEILNLSITSVNHIIYRNKIPFIKNGKKRLFKKADIVKIADNIKIYKEKKQNVFENTSMLSK